IDSGQRTLHHGHLERVAGHFSNLGWSTGILRAGRTNARTECPALRAALTVSRPTPLLAPMIRTVATVSCSQSPARLAIMCDAGSCTTRWAVSLKPCTARPVHTVLPTLTAVGPFHSD